MAHCKLVGKIITECPLLWKRRLEKGPVCDECKLLPVEYHQFTYTVHDPDPRLTIDENWTYRNVRLQKNLPDPKKSHSRLRKTFFVIDPVTRKDRRVYRKDLENQHRFQSALCSLCLKFQKQQLIEFCKEKGYELFDKLKEQERLAFILQGKQRFLDKSIPQLMKQPEMKPSKSFKLRTLEEWRRKHCGQLCIKENPDLKIKIGRREKE